MKILLSRILLPFFVVAFAMSPIRAYAFIAETVELKVYSDVAAVTSGTGSAAFAVGAGAFAFGMAMGYFGLEYLLGDGTKEQVRVPLTSDPAKAVPAPAAPATVPQIPAGTSYSMNASVQYPMPNFTTGIVVISGTASSQSDLCLGAAPQWNAAPNNISPISTPSGAVQYQGGLPYCNVPFSGPITVTSVPASCPAGYVVSGSSCNLQDARQAVPDKKCDFARTGATLAQLADSDCTAALLKMPLVCSAGVCTGQGIDSTGKPQTWAITPRTDGGSIVTVKTQDTVGGQTQVKTATVGVSPAGTVDSTSGSVQAGYIPASSDGSAAAPVTSTDPLASPNQITIPTDYARQGEAATAATQVVQAVNAQTVADTTWRAGEHQRDLDRMGTPPLPAEIPSRTHDLSTFNFSQYSFSGMAVCPADVVIHTSKTDLRFSYSQFCTYLDYLRLLVLSGSLFAATHILLGQRSSENA